MRWRGRFRARTVSSPRWIALDRRQGRNESVGGTPDRNVPRHSRAGRQTNHSPAVDRRKDPKWPASDGFDPGRMSEPEPAPAGDEPITGVGVGLDGLPVVCRTSHERMFA